MASGGGSASVVSKDLVAAAIAAPIDWERLEQLVYAILVADDFPNLRRIGGIGDHGVDAIDEAFYDGNRRVATVVQVTSAHGQRAKVRDTLAKLAKNGITPKSLVLVTRHPVAASTRREMIEAADEEAVGLDIRDADYLIGQLSKPGSIIFGRFFKSAEGQLADLLAQPDPLHAASSSLQHALLATLGAFVLSPHARLARSTLFDKTVLAAIAAQGGPTTKKTVSDAVGALLGADSVELQRIDAALSRLQEAKQCTVSGESIECAPAVIAECVSVANRAGGGFSSLLAHLERAAGAVKALDDAQRGYLERNLRRAVLQLLRAAGPLTSDDEALSAISADAAEEVRTTLARDLPSDTARAVLVAFSRFISEKESASTLAPLVRSYAALAMRNADPIGRRWQQAVLTRTCFVLDTDALLNVIVEELPEHKPLLTALQGLQEQGIELLVPEHVLEEAIGHLGRAGRTYARFADRLLRFPPEIVDGHVWHAVVRGYYYGRRHGYGGTFEQFCTKYHVAEHSRAYVEHLLARRLRLKGAKLDEVPASESDALDQLEFAVLEYRERSRRKAIFRDPAEMSQRVRADVSMALHLAARSSSEMGASARGYLVSADRAFRLLEAEEAWKPRPGVHVWTRAVPELAFFACGSTLADDEAVQILFHPVAIAAADQMRAEIGVLASIGVDLKQVPLERLDWDLRHALKADLDTLEEAVSRATADDDVESARATLQVARGALSAGYPLVPQVAALVTDYDKTQQSLLEERGKREQLEEQLKALVTAAREQSTSKVRRRFNRLVSDLGIEVDGESGAGETSNGEHEQ